MNIKQKKSFKILLFVLAFVICLLIGFFVESLSIKNQQINEKTKLFGLLNGEIIDGLPIITAQDRAEEIASRPAISKTLETQINTTVSRYLESGFFSELDQYLKDIETTYRDSDDLNGVSLEDIQYMRADLAMITHMTPLSSPTMMQSFHNPEFLVAAMVYGKISTKYKAMLHLDSLILPAPENTLPILFVEHELSDDVSSEILSQMNALNNGQIYDQVKVYVCSLYEADLQYIIGHSVLNDTWAAYLIQCEDLRAYTAFHSCYELQQMVNNGYVQEDMLDGTFFPTNLSDVPTAGNNTFSEQNPDAEQTIDFLVGPPFHLNLEE